MLPENAAPEVAAQADNEICDELAAGMITADEIVRLWLDRVVDATGITESTGNTTTGEISEVKL